MQNSGLSEFLQGGAEVLNGITGGGIGPRKTRARQGHLRLPDLDSKENHLHGKLKS